MMESNKSIELRALADQVIAVNKTTASAKSPIQIYLKPPKLQKSIEIERSLLTLSVKRFRKTYDSLLHNIQRVLDVSNQYQEIRPYSEDEDFFISVFNEKLLTATQKQLSRYIDVSTDINVFSEHLDWAPAKANVHFSEEELQELQELMVAAPSFHSITQIGEIIRSQEKQFRQNIEETSRRLRNSSKKVLINLRMDVRKHIRSIISFIYKCFNEVSGCEDGETAALSFLSSIFLNTKNFSNGKSGDYRNFRTHYCVSG